MGLAFKSAAEQAEFDTDAIAIEERASVFFESLTALHEKYEINDDSNSSSTSGGGANSDAPKVTIDGTEYLDYRGIKAVGAVNPNYPDFKSVDGSKSQWLTKKDGSPTQFADKVEKAGV